MLAAVRRHPYLTGAFVVATAAALFFLGLFVVRAVYWEMHSEVPVRPWMTVGYVGRSWDLDPREIDRIAGLPMPERGHPLTLREIAADRGVPVEAIVAEVEAAVAELKARQSHE